MFYGAFATKFIDICERLTHIYQSGSHCLQCSECTPRSGFVNTELIKKGEWRECSEPIQTTFYRSQSVIATSQEDNQSGRSSNDIVGSRPV